MQSTETLKERARAYLAANISINDFTGCHEWTGPLTKDGYGQIGPRWLVDAFGIKGAHRLAVHLAGHEFSGRREQVLHTCHHRRCVNPNHLTTGTAKENIAHAVERGSMCRGSRHPNATITEAKARCIKALLDYGFRNCLIAQALDVSANTVTQIKTGRSWRHVT